MFGHTVILHFGAKKITLWDGGGREGGTSYVTHGLATSKEKNWPFAEKGARPTIRYSVLKILRSFYSTCSLRG